MKLSNIQTKEFLILESLMAGSDTDTRRYLKNMHENFVVPYVNYLNGVKARLDEAELTPDQITQLFGTVTQQSQAAGGNETMLGKMMPDAIKKKFVDSLPAPDAGEVQGFEQKATAAAQQVQDPAAKQGLMQLIKQGLQNPATQKLIIAGVQGIAGVAAGALTGGMGGKLGATAAGAITGGLVGLVAAKLQGQDWKSAAKAGLKGAAVGGAGGLVGSVASGLAGSAMDAVSGSGDQQPAASNEPPQRRGAASGDMKPGDFDKMSQVPTNPDGSPMTVDQINQIKAGQLAGGQSPQPGNPDFVMPADSQSSARAVDVANAEAWRNADAAGKKDIEQTVGMTADQLKNINTGSGAGSSEFAATDPRRVDQQQGTGAVKTSADSGVNPNADAFRKQAQDQIALNQRMQAQADAGGIGKNFDAGIAPIGPNGQPMQAVPMDTGATAGGVPIGSTEPGINRLTGKPIAEPTSWDSMTPDQQADTLAKQQQQAADAEQGTQNAKQYWANKNPITRSLRGESIDRDLTVRMWALNESLGKPRGGVHLSEAGVGDMIKGVGNWLKTKGQNLTQTVTADKLQQAWTKAGKPTDSDKVAELLQKQGVSPDIVTGVYKTMGIPQTATGGEERIEPTMAQEPAAPEAPAPQEPAAPEAPAPQEPAQWPAGLPKFNSVTGQKFASPEEAEQVTNSPEFKQQMADIAAGKDPAQAQQEPAAPTATQEPAAQGGGSGVFADPKKLAASFESFMDADGRLPPQLRGVLKDILLTALRTVENRQRKLNNIIKESKRIEKQIIAIKKRK